MLTLTPQAKAVAIFALATLLVMGSLDRVGSAVARVLDQGGHLSPKTATVVVALVSTVIGLALVYLANQAVSRLDPGWGHALAQAAVVLAVLGTGIALLDLLAAFVGDGYRAGGYYLGAAG